MTPAVVALDRIVLPALAVPYLVAGPGRSRRRVLDLALGGVPDADR